MMIRIRTIVFFIGWFAFTGLIGLFALPALVSQQLTWRCADIWVGFTLGWLRIACGIHSEVRGKPEGPLIACKHQSAWDTLILWYTLGHPAFVLKRELYWIPVFGWFLWRSGQIAINRRAGRQAFAHIEKQAGVVLKQQRRMVIFPEGSRVRIGDKTSFHSGIARISQWLQLDVTPAALNAGLFWPKYTLLKFPGTAIIEFMPTMGACRDNRQSWLIELEAVIEAQSRNLSTGAE